MKSAKLVEALQQKFLGETIFSRKQVIETAEEFGLQDEVKFVVNKNTKIGYNKYSVQSSSNIVPMTPPTPAQPAEGIKTVGNSESYAPEKNPLYVKHESFSDLDAIIKSKMFFPIFIFGPSGTGKTEMVEQAVAANGNRMIRVQVTKETDRDALLGGLRLINGDSVYQEGPITKAAREGITVLIDELDRGTNMLLALQGVLEGKPFELPYSGEVVTPAPGFNVIATGNTKGRGSETGRYNAAMILDDALLERFVEFVEVPHLKDGRERKVLMKSLESMIETTPDHAEFVEKLVKWANVIRQTYSESGVDDEISTRRLLMIIKAYTIYQDKMRAIKGSISRYSEETVEAFLSLYEKVDESVNRE